MVRLDVPLSRDMMTNTRAFKGATQDLHFKQLFHLLDTLGHSWASNCSHVNFGNVQGMSTRKGSVVFLEDILDEVSDLHCVCARSVSFQHSLLACFLPPFKMYPSTT